MKQRFRPYRSVSLPPGIINAAMTSRNSVIAICTPWTVVSRSVLMSLIITFMFEPAKLQMNWASASGRRTARASLQGRIASMPSAIARSSFERTEGRLQAVVRTSSAVMPCSRVALRATSPVQPVWWLAPRPAPLSPWKYS